MFNDAGRKTLIFFLWPNEFHAKLTVNLRVKLAFFVAMHCIFIVCYSFLQPLCCNKGLFSFTFSPHFPPCSCATSQSFAVMN